MPSVSPEKGQSHFRLHGGRSLRVSPVLFSDVPFCGYFQRVHHLRTDLLFPGRFFAWLAHPSHSGADQRVYSGLGTDPGGAGGAASDSDDEQSDGNGHRAGKVLSSPLHRFDNGVSFFDDYEFITQNAEIMSSIIPETFKGFERKVLEAVSEKNYKKVKRLFQRRNFVRSIYRKVCR